MESFPSDLPEEMNGEPSKALPGLMPCGMPAYKFSSCKLCPVPKFVARYSTFILHLVSVFHFKLSLSFLLCRNIVMIITNAIPLERLKIVFMILCQLVAMKIHGLVELLLSEVVSVSFRHVFIISPSTVSSSCPSCPFVDYVPSYVSLAASHGFFISFKLFHLLLAAQTSLPADQPL